MKEDNELIHKFMNGRFTFSLLNKDKQRGTIVLATKVHESFVSNDVSHFEDRYNINVTVVPTRLKYHESWEWLMPVRQKIIDLYSSKDSMPPFEITSHHVKLYLTDGNTTITDIIGCYLESPEKDKESSELKALHRIIVNFIKWYNEQT